MYRYKHAILLVTMLLASAGLCRAQAVHEAALRDSADRLSVQTTLFTGIYSGFGQVHGYTGAVPRISYQVNDRLRLKGGFAVTTDMSSDRYNLLASEPRSLAPRRNTTTGAVAMDVEAEYQLSDNLWMAARFYYLGGSYNSPWGIGDRPMDLNVFGGSMALHYRTKNNNALSIYIDVMHDETGALTPWLYHSPWHSYSPGFLMW